MPYCNKCKLEWEEDIKLCPECGQSLFSSKEDAELNRIPVAFVDPEDSERMIAFLEYSGIHHVIQELEEDTCKILCPEKDYNMAVRLLRIYNENEKKKPIEEKTEEPHKHVFTYVNKNDQAKEAKSSAYSFLFVGGLLILLTVCWILGLVDLPFNSASKLLMQIVFAAMGVIFFLIGISTFRSISRLKSEAVTEEKEHEEIIDWFADTYTKESMDAIIQEKGSAEGTLIDFARLELIRSTLIERYGLEDESYIEALCEEVYQHLYER